MYIIGTVDTRLAGLERLWREAFQCESLGKRHTVAAGRSCIVTLEGASGNDDPSGQSAEDAWATARG